MAKTEELEVLVLRRALLSRLLILTLILLWRLLFRPYDTSASLNPSCLSSPAAGGRSLPSRPILWPRIGAAIEASVVWDGVYFVHIAECGYEYEQTYAFFPLLPLCISLLSRSVFAPLVPMIGFRAVLALSGYVLNNVAFLFAAVYFYRYTESLYALFSLGGLYYLFSGATTIAMLLLALSGSARSNGVLNAGYFCFQAMQHAYDAIIQKKRPILAVYAVIGGVARSICIFVPFLAFQAYGYSNICLGGISYELRPWCKSRIPSLYGFLQSRYWYRFISRSHLPLFFCLLI